LSSEQIKDGRNKSNQMERQMTSKTTVAASAEFRILETSEVDCVAGGFMALGVDVSKMPDRLVGGCGTMWYLSQLGKIFGGSRR